MSRSPNDNPNKTKSAEEIKKWLETVVETVDRTKALEARRLLSHLDHARIPDTVCEETAPKITDLMYQKAWKMCDVDPQELIEFVYGQNKKWANDGYRFVIEGGKSEWQRRRVAYYCLYRAILARFDELHHPARMFDWQSILPTLCNYSHPDRTKFVDIMHRVDILAITEIDLVVPRTKGDLDAILTSVLRARMLGGKPTIITLKRPSWTCSLAASGSEINELVGTKHNVEEDRVVRLRLDDGGDNE